MDARRVRMSYSEVRYIVKSLEIAMTHALINGHHHEAEVFKELLDKYREIERAMKENRSPKQIRLSARKKFIELAQRGD